MCARRKPNSRFTLLGLNQRSKIDEVVSANEYYDVPDNLRFGTAQIRDNPEGGELKPAVNDCTRLAKIVPFYPA